MIPVLDYQNSINLIKNNDLIPDIYKGDIIIADFRGLPLENEFQRLFNFFQQSIYKHYTYGIEPGLFFYNSKITLNAFAAKWKDSFIISFNIGTILFFDQKFKGQTDILNVNGLEDYIEAEKKSDYPLNELMYQLCNNYIFYHELGHLIQNSDGLVEMLHEYIRVKTTFDIQDHIIEFDADLFSSICLGAHLYQYIEKWCPQATDKEAEKIISAATASIFLLIISLGSAKNELYYKEGSHPHPFIRIIGILYVISDYIELLSKRKKQRKLNKYNMIKQLLFVAEKISDKILYGETVTNFKKVFEGNFEDITAYCTKLQYLVAGYSDSAYNRRNERVKK